MILLDKNIAINRQSYLENFLYSPLYPPVKRGDKRVLYYTPPHCGGVRGGAFRSLTFKRVIGALTLTLSLKWEGIERLLNR